MLAILAAAVFSSAYAVDNPSCNSNNYCATYNIAVISGFSAQFDVVGSAIAPEMAEAVEKSKRDALLKVSVKLEGYGVFGLSESHCGDATVHQSESNISLIDVIITCDIPSVESELSTMFESNPSGSIVQINGTVVGITPIAYNKYQLIDVIRGVNVRIVHEGYVADEFPFRPSYQTMSLRSQLVLKKQKAEPFQIIQEEYEPVHEMSKKRYSAGALAISIPLIIGGGVCGGIALINKEKRDHAAEEYDALTGIEHDWFLTEETKKQQNALLISAAMLGTTGLAIMIAGAF